MTPPVLEEVIAGKAVETLAGGGKKRDALGGLGQTLLILSVVVCSQWITTRGQVDAYNALVTKLVEQNAADQKANREALTALGQQLSDLKQSNRDLSETIRAAFYVSRGADAPQRQARAR